MNRYNLLFVLSLCISWTVLAKTPPPNVWQRAAQLDTTRLLSDTPLKSPMGAVYRSAILPGWGQLYNQHHWKSAFVAALNGYMVYQIVRSDLKLDDTGNKKYRDRRSDFSWYFGLTYLLTMVDAYVDAYLFGFDKAMDIGLLTPAGEPYLSSTRLYVRFRF